MKKILALVLAVMMLTSLAFAVVVAPGTKIRMDKDDNNAQGFKWDVAPDKRVNSDNYSISKIDWEDGKKYIDSVSFDDEKNDLVVKLVQNFKLTEDSDASFYGTVKIREKGKNVYHIATFGSEDAQVDVYYGEDFIVLDSGNDANFVYAEDTIYTVDDPEDASYGTLEYDFGGEGQYGLRVRVYDEEEFFLEVSEDANLDILKANADVDAEYIDFIEWVGRPEFTNTATIEFYGAEEDDYIYEIKDGKLVVPANLKYDKDAEVWTLRTRTAGAYVVSDAPLKAAAATDSTVVANPDTGANDVVGIAGALAVVAMVSAAAVSLKK